MFGRGKIITLLSARISMLEEREELAKREKAVNLKEISLLTGKVEAQNKILELKQDYIDKLENAVTFWKGQAEALAAREGGKWKAAPPDEGRPARRSWQPRRRRYRK